MGKKNYYVVWTVYYDIDLSRNSGRKVSRKLAVKKPGIEDLIKSVNSLGFEYEVYPEKKYPKNWFSDTSQGYLLIRKKEGLTKTTLLKVIGEKIRELRGV